MEGEGSMVGYHFRSAGQGRPTEMGACALKTWGEGWNAFQTETDTVALECWRPVPPIASQLNPSCPSRISSKAVSPKKFFLPFPGRMAFFLPEILTYSSDNFMILSSCVDIGLKNIH